DEGDGLRVEGGLAGRAAMERDLYLRGVEAPAVGDRQGDVGLPGRAAAEAGRQGADRDVGLPLALALDAAGGAEAVPDVPVRHLRGRDRAVVLDVRDRVGVLVPDGPRGRPAGRGASEGADAGPAEH